MTSQSTSDIAEGKATGRLDPEVVDEIGTLLPELLFQHPKVVDEIGTFLSELFQDPEVVEEIGTFLPELLFQVPDVVDGIGTLFAEHSRNKKPIEIIKVRAVHDFDPRKINVRERKELLAISRNLKIKIKDSDYVDYDKAKHYSENTEHLRKFCPANQSIQDKQSHRNNELIRPSKVRVYSRREETFDNEDQEKAIQMEEWKRIIRQTELVKYQKHHQNVNQLDKPSLAEVMNSRTAESNWESKPLHSKGKRIRDYSTVDIRNQDGIDNMEEPNTSIRARELISEKVVIKHPNDKNENLNEVLLSSRSRQGIEVHRRNELRPSKVKVYSRREEIFEVKDQEKTVNIEEWKTVIYRNYWTHSDWKLDRRLEWESVWISEKEVSLATDRECKRISERECYRTSIEESDWELDRIYECESDSISEKELNGETEKECNRVSKNESDRISEWESDWVSESESDRELVLELVSCHSDESDESFADLENVFDVLPLAFKRGDKMLIQSAGFIGDTTEWWNARQLNSEQIGFIPRKRVVVENDQLSNTKLNKLPLELLDLILENAFIHWIVNLSPNQRDANVIKTLSLVDYCWFQRTTKTRFNDRIKHRLRDCYENTRKRPAIVRANQNYLSETIQLNDDFIAALQSSNCLTKEQCHLFQRRRFKRFKQNDDLLHFLRYCDDTRFSAVVKCLRQTNQKTAARIMENGGGVIKVEVGPRKRGANCSASMNTKELKNRLDDLQNRTKTRSRETHRLISQLKDEGIEILNSQLDGQAVVVWIWCRSQGAIETIRMLYDSNQLREIFIGLIDNQSLASEITESTVINIDQKHFKKTVVKCPLYINFTEGISLGYNRILGVTKLRNKIYVLSNDLIHVFEDQNLSHYQRKLKFEESKSLVYLESNEKENCIYLGDSVEKCIWKVTRDSSDLHKVIKWLPIDDFDSIILSISKNGLFLVVSNSPPIILKIYASNAKLVRSIQLNVPTNNCIKKPIHAVENSLGHFIILHETEETGEIDKFDGEEQQKEQELKKKMWLIIEVTADGQRVIRQFNPSSETQKLSHPDYLTIDSDDRVFVSDRGNRRVILLNSYLDWDQILFSTKEEELELKDFVGIVSYDGDGYEEVRRCSFCYDEEKKQLVVTAVMALGLGIVVYNLSQK